MGLELRWYVPCDSRKAPAGLDLREEELPVRVPGETREGPRPSDPIFPANQTGWTATVRNSPRTRNYSRSPRSPVSTPHPLDGDGSCAGAYRKESGIPVPVFHSLHTGSRVTSALTRSSTLPREAVLSQRGHLIPGRPVKTRPPSASLRHVMRVPQFWSPNPDNSRRAFSRAVEGRARVHTSNVSS